MIDFHVHCYPPHLAQRAVDATILHGGKRDATPRGIAASMLANRICCSIALHVANIPETQRDVNRFAIRIHSPTLISFGTVHPDAPDALEELERLKAAGIPGVKLHPIFQRFCIDRAKYIPLYQAIGRLGFITMIHCGLAGTGYEFVCTPSAVAKVIHHFGGAPVILAHMGGVLLQEEEYSVLHKLPVYLDTSLCAESLPPRYPVLLSRERFAQIVERHGIDRILFGSDYPWGTPSSAFTYLQSVGLSTQEMQKITYSNAKNLLGF